VSDFGGNTEDIETGDWGSRDDFRTKPGEQQPVGLPEPPQSPMTTLPMMPTPPAKAPPMPVATPTAPTIMTLASPYAPNDRAPTGMAPIDLDGPSPASTAKGFAPPQAYPVMPERPMPVVMDVTPRSLGIATVAGYCEELIRRNSRLPTEMVKMFTTSRDLQNAVRIVVCQGESRRLESNVVIGDLRLEGLAARPRGETSIEVTFSLDASGILQVRARDSQTGREQRASLDLVGGVREQDVSAARDRIQQLRR
jgi:molecular chaperone DnaK